MLVSFTAEHGHRGPNDWEISGRTWDNTPELVLMAIDRMRVAEGDLQRLHDAAAETAAREAAIQKVRPNLNVVDRMNFDKAIKAAPVWAQAREATRPSGAVHAARQTGVPRTRQTFGRTRRHG